MLEAKVTLLTRNTSNREIMATKILDEGKKLEMFLVQVVCNFGKNDKFCRHKKRKIDQTESNPCPGSSGFFYSKNMTELCFLKCDLLWLTPE